MSTADPLSGDRPGAQVRGASCVLEMGECADDLARRLRVVGSRTGLEVWVASPGPVPEGLRAAVAQSSARVLNLDGAKHWTQCLARLEGDPVAWIPARAELAPMDPPAAEPAAVTVWPPTVELPDRTARPATSQATACWLSRDLLKALATCPPASPGPVAWGEALRRAGVVVRWRSPPRVDAASPRERPAAGAGGLRRTDRVCAVVPHYGCERWLGQCLESLLQQTRPLDGIVVVDDASAVPPVDLVRCFPQVTLLRSAENVGPYRLVQTVIDATDFDAYLFQDADDWSMANRLELLLREAERTGAELIGGQELRVLSGEDDALRPVVYPLDVNDALAESPGHPLLHPTSLVARRLVQRVGGFATTLRFGGDTEFLLRAVFGARIVNVPELVYFRRHRPCSLTTAVDTGLGSPAREALLRQVKARAREHMALARRRLPLDTSPLGVAGSVPWAHLAGPPLVVGARPKTQRRARV